MSWRDVGAGRTDVWRSRNLDGVYGEVENLGDAVNTEGSETESSNTDNWKKMQESMERCEET